MNQILVTEKLYITPELRRKKKMYKFQFLFSVVLVCSLFSYYIYADYDRNKSEEVSHEILAGIQAINDEQNQNQNEETEEPVDNTVVKICDGIIFVALEDDFDDNSYLLNNNNENGEQGSSETQNLAQTYTATNGETYDIDATLNIPSLGINYPVLSDWSEDLLKVSVNKYWGPEPNEIGNYCIIGHNYRSGKMFGMLPAIANGDLIELTDTKYGRTVVYEVYDRYQIDPTDTKCTSQLTGGKREITLITCKEYGTQRLVVKAREVK